MNKRILELIKQAGGIGHDDDGNKLTPMLVGKEIEQLAELIVKECADVCESMQLIGPYKQVQDATLKDAAVQIKQHFGVEP